MEATVLVEISVHLHLVHLGNEILRTVYLDNCIPTRQHTWNEIEYTVLMNIIELSN